MGGGVIGLAFLEVGQELSELWGPPEVEDSLVGAFLVGDDEVLKAGEVCLVGAGVVETYAFVWEDAVELMSSAGFSSRGEDARAVFVFSEAATGED